MPLNPGQLASDLETAITAAISEVFDIKLPEGKPILDKFSKALADAIAPVVVSHIQDNALVSTNVVGSVTSGPGAGGAVVGTGTGTVA